MGKDVQGEGQIYTHPALNAHACREGGRYLFSFLDAAELPAAMPAPRSNFSSHM